MASNIVFCKRIPSLVLVHVMKNEKTKVLKRFKFRICLIYDIHFSVYENHFSIERIFQIIFKCLMSSLLWWKSLFEEHFPREIRYTLGYVRNSTLWPKSNDIL